MSLFAKTSLHPAPGERPKECPAQRRAPSSSKVQPSLDAGRPHKHLDLLWVDHGRGSRGSGSGRGIPVSGFRRHPAHSAGRAPNPNRGTASRLSGAPPLLAFPRYLAWSCHCTPPAPGVPGGLISEIEPVLEPIQRFEPGYSA